MPKKHRKFADDGWAIWIDGDDTSTIHINDWLNPKGKSYIDIAIHIRGIGASKLLNVYVFSAACIVDYKKNQHTSEIAYNGKTIDIVHISTLNFKAEPLSNGTLICVDLQELQPYLDNDEAYFIWRMPHKSLNAIFKPYVDVGNVMERLRDLITTPVVSEKYGYSVRINESRLLPEEITRIGMFHRQKLKKAAITISIDENYELNDSGCYRIRRLEEKLYRHYLPEDYRCEDIITYQWNQNREDSLQGQFNFYYSITKNSISRASMLLYMILLLAVGVFGDFISEAVQALIRLFI